MKPLTKKKKFEIQISERECFPNPEKPLGWWQSEGQYSNQFRCTFTDMVGDDWETWLMKSVFSCTFRRDDELARGRAFNQLMDSVNEVISQRIKK